MNRFTASFLPVFAICLFFGSSVFADPMSDKEIVKAIEALQDNDTIVGKGIEEAVDAGADKVTTAIHQGTMKQLELEQKRDMGLSPDMDMRSGLAARMGGIPAVEVFIQDLMATRTKQMNGVPIERTTNPNASIVNIQLVDTSSLKAPIMDQQFSIFMRYFCDPLSAAGEMADVNIGLTGSNSVKCGNSDTNGANSRASYAASSSVSAEQTALAEREIINAPLDPYRLFFKVTTYPVARVADGTVYHTNVNPFASLFPAAIVQSIEFLTGGPPETVNKGDLQTDSQRTEYLATQARNTRKSIATYVFSLLAGDRVQAMGSDMSMRLASLLERYMGEYSFEQNTAARISMLRRQTGVSMSEYMNIMMYEIPTAPGYISAIDRMTPEQAVRERIRLNALQLAVNYQRNHWLEILSALEATDTE